MASAVRIAEGDLRGAMRDPRHWRNGHPERDSFAQRVGEGFQDLYPKDAASRSAVWVRAYVRNGDPVAAHWRAAPEGGGDGAVRPAAHRSRTPNGDDDGFASPANWSFLFRHGLRRSPEGRPAGAAKRPTHDRLRRWPDAEGRDRVEDLRRAPDTREDGVPQGDVDQWFALAAKPADSEIWKHSGRAVSRWSAGPA